MVAIFELLHFRFLDPALQHEVGGVGKFQTPVFPLDLGEQTTGGTSPPDRVL